MRFSSPDPKSWYAVNTRAKCEKVVESDVSEFCTTYLPIQIVRRKWSDRYKMLEVPLIPSYIFIKFTEKDRLRIYRHPNIIKVLGVSGRFNPIPEREIELVRRIEASRLPFQFTCINYHFNLGDRIIFNAGPLMGEEGYLEKFLNNHRVYIHVPSLNGYFTTNIEEISPHYSEMELETLVA